MVDQPQAVSMDQEAQQRNAEQSPIDAAGIIVNNEDNALARGGQITDASPICGSLKIVDTIAEDGKLDTAVSNLGSQKLEEQAQAKKDIQAAGASGLEALLRNHAFSSENQNIQTMAREIVNEYSNAYVRNHPDESFSEALKEWNNEIRGLPANMAETLPRGLLEFAALVNHPSVKADAQPEGRNNQELRVLVKAIGESNTNMGSFRGDTDQTIAAAIPYLPNLRSLRLGDPEVDPPKITAETLKNIKQLRHLEKLYLNHLGLKGDELSTIKDMDSLKSLLLGDDPITDVAVASLAHLQNLEGLALDETKITDKGFDELSKAKNFKTLVLSGSNVTDKWLKNIGNMTNLSRLQINGGAITDEGVRQLAGLQKLSWLNLNENKDLTDNALKTVTKLPLTKLEMVAPKITESPVNATLLGGMPHLKELEIRGSTGFQRRIEKTRITRKLPECEINLVEPEKKAEAS